MTFAGTTRKEKKENTGTSSHTRLSQASSAKTPSSQHNITSPHHITTSHHHITTLQHHNPTTLPHHNLISLPSGQPLRMKRKEKGNITNISLRRGHNRDTPFHPLSSSHTTLRNKHPRFFRLGITLSLALAISPSHHLMTEFLWISRYTQGLFLNLTILTILTILISPNLQIGRAHV